MKKTVHYASVVVGLVMLVSVVAASASARTSAAPEVMLTALSPLHAVAGQLVTISGTNLEGMQSVTFVVPKVTGIPSQSVAVDPGGTWVRALVPPNLPVGP